MYQIIGEADSYIEESNGNKYLTFVFTDKNKEVLIKHTEIWDEIKYLIKAIHGGKASEYWENFMKNKFNLDDNLPINKALKLHILTVIGRFDFEENGNLDVCFYQL